MDDFFQKQDSADNAAQESESKTAASSVTGESSSAGDSPVSEPIIQQETEAQPSFTADTYGQDPYPPVTEQQFSSDGFGASPAVQNRINYSDIAPVVDYKPMSRGLKLFAIIMAAVILLTGVSVTGYFLGRSSISVGTRKNVTVDLSAKPKDTDEMTAAEVYEKVNPSVVGITVYNSAGNGSQASGVFYSQDGYIVTNDHIYSEVGAPNFKVYTSDGKEYDAKYIAGDQVSDLAVLKIDGSGFTPADFGNSDELVFGENVVAIGRPSDATDASSITKGIISSTGRRVKSTSNYSAKLIQTDSAINPGSSGGALVNMYGQVIGITSSKLAGVSYDAVGYAIPTKTMKRICEELISKGRVVSRAKLGITYTAINSVTAEINGYDCVGLYVASVGEDSDLYGKVTEGDVITHINGIEVTSDDIVLDIIEESSAGDKVSVTVLSKSGRESVFDVTLKANTGESSYSSDINSGSSSSDGGSGGTFDFPFGE
ncbi:MAG: S1C family serine protease [Acutalibacteraceae bacterium]